MAKKDNKSKKQENSKNKKSFFKDFKAELKKVIWPTPKQLVNNTITVIVMVLITAVIVFALDFIFETINEQGIERVKSIVSTEQTNEVTENQTTEAENTETTDQENAVQNESTSENVEENNTTVE